MPAKYGSQAYTKCRGSKCYIGNAGKKGMGVFACKNIKKDHEFEISPIIVVKIDDDDWSYFDDYIYDLGDGKYAMALGFGSLYNHSLKPNADYTFFRYEDDTAMIGFRALKEIADGEEITINYNGEPKDKTPWDFS